jgi:uncharacterized membrane protein (DUF2068 family)
MSGIHIDESEAKPDRKQGGQGGLLPGMAVISLWMLAQCGLGLIGVFLHKVSPGMTVVCVMFALAANGLLKLKRWGWALTLGAAFLSMCYATYMLVRLHELQMVVMLMVNLVFFMYLIRPEVIERLK